MEKEAGDIFPVKKENARHISKVGMPDIQKKRILSISPGK